MMSKPLPCHIEEFGERYWWSNEAEIAADGEAVVSHAGLVLLLRLAEATGLTAGLSQALASARLLVHAWGRGHADLAYAMATAAR